MATAEKTRTPRKPLTEMGYSLRGFVSAVNQHKLAIKVGALIGENDTEKVHSSIQSFVRKAGQKSGVVSVRSKALAEAIVKAVVELDGDLAAKGETLLKNFSYQSVQGTHTPDQNWIVRLKGGEEIFIKDGPDGDGVYKLAYVRAADVAEAAEGETEGEVEN